MAQFFSYPYNYLQNFEKSTEGSTESDNTDSRSKANIVSNKNLNDSVKSESITFDFVLNEGDSFNIDSIQIVSKKVKGVKVNNKEIGFLKTLGPIAERSGLLYTIDTAEGIICSIDLTGQIISRIKTITPRPGSLSDSKFISDGNDFWLINNNQLSKIDSATGVLENIGDNFSESPGHITFYQNEIYTINNNKIFTIRRHGISGEPVIVDTKSDNSSSNNFPGTINDLTSLNGRLYALVEDTGDNKILEITKLKSSDEPADFILSPELDGDGLPSNLTKLISYGNSLYVSTNDFAIEKFYKVNLEDGSTTKVSSTGKQYLFSDQFTPVNISSTENLNQLTLQFEAISGTPEIYQVLLLKKKMEIRYSSPTPGFGNPYIDDAVPGGEVVQPSDFSQIEPVQNEQGLITHQNTYGQRIKQRAYASHAKYQTSYTLPIRTLKQVRALQNFRENNLNFTFAQNTVLYPDRIYPAHFSSFDLPISYISKTLAQDGKYTFNFTITEN